MKFVVWTTAAAARAPGGRRGRGLALAWLALLAPTLAPPEALSCDDVNVLVNPSGEEGPDPWEYVNQGSRHETGPVTISTGTVQATDGSAWFAGERTETAVSIGTSPLRVEQWVDVRGLGEVTCARMRADYFGVAEITAGAGMVEELITVRLDFYDEAAINPIGAAFEVDGPLDLSSPAQRLGFEVETMDIPAGTAFIVARMQGQMNLNTTNPGVPATGHAVLGADHAVLSISLPEPGAEGLGLTALGALGLLARRWRRADQPEGEP